MTSCVTRPPAIPASDFDTLPWGALALDINADNSEYTLKESMGEVLRKKIHEANAGDSTTALNILALSGGGSGGAYGAGLLNGWKDHGDIPQFDIVTSVSTGSIMSSFAFLGGDYIDQLDSIFRNLETSDLYVSSWLSLFNGATLNDPTPLKNLLRDGIDEQFLAEIAREHQKGRRLYMGTTNLDTGQLVVWDMGAIASSDRTDKLQRYRDIIYASSAVPIIFPPHFFNLDIDGNSYSQMHVDGGVYSNVFMIGLYVDWMSELQLTIKNDIKIKTNLYMIANRKYRERHAYDPMPLKFSPVFDAFITVETDLLFDRSVYRIYNSIQDRNIDFHIATIPQDANHIQSMMEFVPKEMRAIYGIAYDKASNGYPWKKEIRWNEYDLQGDKDQLNSNHH